MDQTVRDLPVGTWPAGLTRVPYWVYRDPEVARDEQARLFEGPAWHFLCLEIDLPEVGDYRTTMVGAMPVVVARAEDGAIVAFENRCAHRGALICFEDGGRVKDFHCVYHAWRYDLRGNLCSVAFQRGVGGKGGMASTFKKEDNALQRLRTHVICGLVFGTLNEATPPFEDYVGPDHVANIKRVCGRPLRILGEYSQRLPSNWKLYIENVKDPYHASILHAFNGVMKQDRLTMEGGIKMGSRGWHHISYSKMHTDTGDEIYSKAAMRNAEIEAYGFGLRDHSMTDIWDDFGDRITMTITTIFPNFVLQQLRNSLAVRTIVPKGTHESELRWVAFGFQDDDERKFKGRLKQANMMGPAGLIAMEDGMIGGLVQKGIAGDLNKAAVIEMGGHGIEPIPGSRVSEGSVRGFWTGYRALMGF